YTVAYTQLASDIKNGYPAMAFITPNMCNDMHNCPVSTGDQWLQANLPAIINYDAAHNGLLILTYDESLDSDPTNHIMTMFVGPMVKAVRSAQNINHYSVLRTIEQLSGLPLLGKSAGATTITGIWK
ncbi:MAG: acid phosphatase, partial [Candidatus Eremiobacteraeota bacterium]|nr:acid phosphatase [Candidatus Eremiobacteraeota bacterium]